MPSLLQRIVGSGTPDAVQAMTTGDSLVTTSSVGSSAIDGGTRGTYVRTCKENLILLLIYDLFRNEILKQNDQYHSIC